jgi:uncharacterized protein
LNPETVTQVPLYNDYSSYIKNKFGQRVQKISINTGYSCPNRDGTKGLGGCTYCNIASIKPEYSKASKSITQQLQEGVKFFSKKYKALKYFAYFQSYTNTYNDKSTLIKAYEEALTFPGVVGIVVATRPDCIDEELVEIFKEISNEKYVSIELGIESTCEESLLKINRCHTHTDSEKAIGLLAEKGINVGAHLILGLPWESKDIMVSHAKKLSGLPLNSVKIHHLQILKNTQLEKDHQKNNFKLLTSEEYIELLVDFLECLNPEITVQRFIAQSPDHLLISPQWGGIKNYQFRHLLEKKMSEKNSWQGKHFRT